MGAETFFVKAKGKNAKEAFAEAVDVARHEHGHGGYTGTIAEKYSFVEIFLPEKMDAFDYAHYLIEKDDKRIEDKFGPAGCLKIADGEYLFFGWSPS